MSKTKEALSASVKQEYATKLTLIGIFLSIFAFVTGLFFRGGGRRTAPRKEFKIRPFDLLMLGLSAMRLGRMVAYDRVTEPLRYPFAQTKPDETGAGETVEPRGQGVRASLGQLLSCPICAGTWISAGLVYGLMAIPGPTQVFLAITSSIGLAEVLNSLTEALSWLGELARALTGAENKAGNGRENSLSELFRSGGSYYVGNDHAQHYRQSGR